MNKKFAQMLDLIKRGHV